MDYDILDLPLRKNDDESFKEVYARIKPSVKHGMKNNILLTCNPTGFDFFYKQFFGRPEIEHTQPRNEYIFMQALSDNNEKKNIEELWQSR